MVKTELKEASSYTKINLIPVFFFYFSFKTDLHFITVDLPFPLNKDIPYCAI